MAKGKVLRIFDHKTVINEVEFLIETQRGIKVVSIREGSYAQIARVSKPSKKKKSVKSRL